MEDLTPQEKRIMADAYVAALHDLSRRNSCATKQGMHAAAERRAIAALARSRAMS